MPASMNVNGRTVVHKDSGGTTFIYPDVCWTPTSKGPKKRPYPNTAKSADTIQGSVTVTVDGNPIMLKSSYFEVVK